VIDDSPVQDSTPTLRIASGSLNGTALRLTEAAILIGRGTSKDDGIRIPDSAISKTHCVLRRLGDSYVLADLDSRHGTFVNEGRIREMLLAHGDRIRIGRSSLLFENRAQRQPVRDIGATTEGASKLVLRADHS
jgi:pSer/pThr/pTyr-binding forkhead associated (FHA) protein